MTPASVYRQARSSVARSPHDGGGFPDYIAVEWELLLSNRQQIQGHHGRRRWDEYRLLSFSQPSDPEGDGCPIRRRPPCSRFVDLVWLQNAVEDADAGGAGYQGERLSDVGVGNRVEIAVEADIGGLAGADDAHQVGLEGMSG